MRIVLVSPYLPYPPRGGGETRIYHLLRLASERHDVHLLTLAPAPDFGGPSDDAVASLRTICRVTAIPARSHTLERRLRTFGLSTLPDMALRGRSAELEQTLQAVLRNEQPDIVQLESIEMLQYGSHSRQRRIRRPSPLLCYDAFNAEHQLQRRAFVADIGRARSLPLAFYSLVQWQKLRRYERLQLRQCDLIFAVSEADRRTLARLTRTPPQIEVVPNGVDTRYFANAGRERRNVDDHDQTIAHGGILFTGTLDFRPNVDAVTWFVRNVWKLLHERRPELRFRIVGQRPVPTVIALGTVPGVDVVGAVEDMRPWFAAAQVYVLPMWVGGGVRLKLLEAWATATPCVTTSLGAEGVEEFQPGVHALVADEPHAFLTATEQLLDDRALAANIAQAGRELAAAYDWRPIFARMEHAWCGALDKSSERL